jgi:hypothetical protein
MRQHCSGGNETFLVPKRTATNRLAEGVAKLARRMSKVFKTTKLGLYLREDLTGMVFVTDDPGIS